MEEQKVLFYHGKTIDDHRFTIAGQFSPFPKNGDDQEIDVIILGASLCSPQDQFVKKTGRKKAEGRMNSEAILKGRTYYHLYNKTRLEGWFIGKEVNTFIDAVKDYELMRSAEFKSDFHL